MTNAITHAARALLNSDHRVRAQSLAAATRMMRQAQGQECPHCGERDEHESNSDGSTFLCTGCGEQWDSDEIELG
jgi:transposase-like protein